MPRPARFVFDDCQLCDDVPLAFQILAITLANLGFRRTRICLVIHPRYGGLKAKHA
jgi:hypothetical protein